MLHVITRPHDAGIVTTYALHSRGQATNWKTRAERPFCRAANDAIDPTPRPDAA